MCIRDSYNRKTFSNFQLNDLGGWDASQHGNKTYLINGKESYSVHTGWVKESANDMVKDLLISKAVWLRFNGQELPVIVRDNQKKFINRLWEREIGYTFNLEAANDILL